MSDPVTAPLWLQCYLLPLSEVMLISGFGESHEAPGRKGYSTKICCWCGGADLFSLYQDTIIK